VATSVALAGRLGLAAELVVEALGGGPLVSSWQAANDDDRFAALAGLADQWQQAVDAGFGGQDLTVVTRLLEQQEKAP
jgi:hypothetical protein